MKNLKYFGFCFFGIWIFNSCKKDNPPPPPEIPDEYENGLLVLSEGLFQQNNASISFYAFGNNQVYTQSFFSENARGLGDTANDFEKYALNGTEYIIIAVDVSSQLEIVEANTLLSVAQIPVFDGTNAREPRCIEVYGTKAFVCNFDGTVSVVDLISKSITNTLLVGANPDGMTIVGNQLYVSNSGGLNFPIYDSTITVINMDNLQIVDTIQSRINSSKMIVDSQNEIYLLSNGNYASIDPALVRINTSTNQVIETFDIPLSSMTAVGDWIYFYDENEKKIRRFNALTETVDSAIILDCSDYETFFGLHYIAELNLIYCVDANGYVNSSTIKCYNTSGTFQYEFTAELNSKNIIYND